MNPLFADTFYWIALVDFTDSAHQRALTLTSERGDSPIVTTDEASAEFLTFLTITHGVSGLPCVPQRWYTFTNWQSGIYGGRS